MKSVIISLIFLFFGFYFLINGFKLFALFLVNKRIRDFFYINLLISLAYIFLFFMQLSENIYDATFFANLFFIILIISNIIYFDFLKNQFLGYLNRLFKYLNIASTLIMVFPLLYFLSIKSYPINVSHNGKLWIFQFNSSFLYFYILFYLILLISFFIILSFKIFFRKNSKRFLFVIHYFAIYLFPLFYFIPEDFMFFFRGEKSGFINYDFKILLISVLLFVYLTAERVIIIKKNGSITKFNSVQKIASQNISDFIFLFNRNLELVDTTARTAQMLGYSEFEIYKIKFNDIFLLDFDILKFINSDISTNTGNSDKISLRKKDGSLLPVNINIKKLIYNKGKLAGFIIIAFDITDEKTLIFINNENFQIRQLFNDSIKKNIDIIEALPYAIAFINLNGNITICNNKFAYLSKQSKNKLIESKYLELAKSDLFEKVIEIDDFQKDNTSSKNFTPDGKRYYKYQIKAIYSENGILISYLALMIDISEKIKIHKFLTDNPKYYTNLINSFPLGVMFIDKNARITDVSETIFQYMGKINFDGESGLNILNYLDTLAYDSSKNTVIEFLNGKSNEKFSSFKNLKINPSKIFKGAKDIDMYLNLNLFKIKSDNEILVLMLENVIQVLNLEKKALRINRRIENRIKLDLSFFNTISFEIRKILVEIYEKSLLAMNLYKSQEMIDFFNKIILSSNKLFKMVENILLLYAIESDKLIINFQKVQFFTIINKIISDLRVEAEKKGLKINFIIENEKYRRQNIYVLLDPYLFSIIFENIIENSIKFSDRGNIDIHMYFDEIGSENIILKVIIKDQGIGIPQDKLYSIFDGFYQIENTISKKFEGLGIGLKISKNLIEKSGGKINVESKENAGTTITIILPLMKIDDKKIYEDLLFEQDLNTINKGKILFLSENLNLLNLFDILVDNLNEKKTESKVKDSIMLTEFYLNNDIELFIQKIIERKISIVFVDSELFLGKGREFDKKKNKNEYTLLRSLKNIQNLSIILISNIKIAVMFRNEYLSYFDYILERPLNSFKLEQLFGKIQ